MLRLALKLLGKAWVIRIKIQLLDSHATANWLHVAPLTRLAPRRFTYHGQH